MLLRCSKPFLPFLRDLKHAQRIKRTTYRKYSQSSGLKRRNGPVFHEEPLGYPADNGYGFLNINIGDPIGAKGRYIVCRKLGYGAYSSVWLAKDTQPLRGESSYVAVKALTQHASELARCGEIDELKLMQTISWSKDSCGGRAHCVRFIEADLHFMEGEETPNICIVTEVLGQDVLNLRRRFKDRALPVELTKTITEHVVRALAHLHANGIVHTDLKIDNIALSSYYSDTELDRIVESDQPRYYPSQDVFGKHVKPLISQPLPFLERIPKNGYNFKLADFGHSHWLDQTDQEEVDGLGTRTVRAPEVMLGDRWNEKVDIWGLGCLVFEFLTGKPLFSPKDGPDYSADVHHLGLIMQDLHKGEQKKLREAAKDSDNSILQSALDFAANTQKEHIRESMRQHLSMRLDGEMLDDTLRFLERCLQLNSKSRASARELVDDTWFQS